MARRKWSFWGITAAVVGLLAVAAAVYIMVHGLGLNPDLDYGAGAYYYADIPDYEKTLDWDTYSAGEAGLPFWVYLLFFFGWGALVWAVWKRLG